MVSASGRLGWRRRRWRVLVVSALGLLTVVVPSRVVADDDDQAVALVNGYPISRAEMIDILIDAHGVEVLQQMIILHLAKQETKKRGIRVTKSELNAEIQMTLDGIAEKAGMTGEYATEKNKQEALQRVLDERGVSLIEFTMGMERNAHLRKLVQKDLRVTDATLREEFARTRGEKVVVRHIQIARNDTHGLNQALELLNRGADFADVAKRLSKNPQTAVRGGEMDPFTFMTPDDVVPAAIREIAFSLKPGEVSSPVLTDRYFHILKLERRIPPDDVRFENVREEVERSVRQRATIPAMQKLAVELFKQAKIVVLDGDLRNKYQDFLDEGAVTPQQP